MVVGQFTQDVDILVIGGGPSGYTAAFRAAELGKTVALVDPKESLGGECLHNACIPSKSAHFGGSVEERKSTIQALAKGLEQRCSSLEIERLHGVARFENSKTVQITGEVVSIVRFRKAIIASGSSKRTHPDYQDNVCQVEDVYGEFPSSGKILIVGDATDAVEAATFLCNTHEVTLQISDMFLPQFDRELVKFVERPLSNLITIQSQNTGDPSQYDVVVLAGQREPSVGSLHLDTAEVTCSDEGITTNESCQTSNPKIYAVGECSGCHNNAGLAINQGRVAAEHACGLDSVVDASFIPLVAWSNPQIAQCGMLTEAATRVNLPNQTASTRWGNSGLAVALGYQNGMTAITFDPHTQVILGIGIVGQGAPELISEGVLALEMGATLYDLASIVRPHPTFSELLSDTARAGLATLL